jgi:hypothetical protein
VLPLIAENRNPYGALVEKTDGKRPLGRHKGRWEDNIKNSSSKMGGVDWIDLAQEMDRWRALVNAVMNLRVP